MSIFEEYSSDSAYFIAGGETLEIIKKFEEDAKNYKAQLAAVASEHGAQSVYDGGDEGFIFTLHRKSSDPALSLKSEHEGSDGNPTRYTYKVNMETPEGQALQARLEDMPRSTKEFTIFAKRLTKTDLVATNPDNLIDRQDYASRIGHYQPGNEEVAASYHYCKFDDVYVVEIPRVIRGVDVQFNEAAEKFAGGKAAGYEYEWFTPPDCGKPIFYSQVIALQEKDRGNQIQPRRVKANLEINPPTPRY